MDSLDRWAATAVTALLVSTLALLVTADENDAPPASAEKRLPLQQQMLFNPELDNKIQLARRLLAHNNLEQTEIIADSLIGEFPFAGEPYMLKGDVLMRRQQPVAAMYEYKNAVELNPDFLDKKAEVFQGKKIRLTVEEALMVIRSGLQQTPGDPQLRDARKAGYYMKRKIAGSCG